jgi:hypothetical protein
VVLVVVVLVLLLGQQLQEAQVTPLLFLRLKEMQEVLALSQVVVVAVEALAVPAATEALRLETLVEDQQELDLQA